MLLILVSDPGRSDTNGSKIMSKCVGYMSLYGIDPTVKSYKGWLRVCKYDKLSIYTKNGISIVLDKAIICECFEDNYTNRDIEVVVICR